MQLCIQHLKHNNDIITTAEYCTATFMNQQQTTTSVNCIKYNR